MNNIGEKLKLLRVTRHLTQAGLAKKSGVAQQLISQYEQGATAIGVKNLAKLAAALGCEAAAIDDRIRYSGGVADANTRRIDDDILLLVVDNWADLPPMTRVEIGGLIVAAKKTRGGG
ncbi:hypothetical protein FACS1894139_09800 [Planctomycetales bacterium]|nr:hypothetical protein FACS1894107_17200 [Planctomycetales bacterium]GHT00199.1 hypothetical protein FACS1894108_11730 [Planctomycetales bacterium]GHT05625.1 hypothetical protein FACS1894139_09800 [Planctomycetales bacterium]